MEPVLLAVTLAVGLGAVVAVSARTARAAVFGLLLAGLASAFVADPLPDSLGLAARLVGTVLGGYLLWIVTRGQDARTEGSRLGWPVETVVAVAAAVVGYGSHGLGAQADGPPLAQAAGFGLLALAMAPLLNGRDVLRLAVGLWLLVIGAILVRTALGGTPDPLEQLVVGLIAATLGGVCALAAAAARSEGGDGFSLAPDQVRRTADGMVRAPRPADAHPAQPE